MKMRRWEEEEEEEEEEDPGKCVAQLSRPIARFL
jgi:hypothetical protein